MKFDVDDKNRCRLVCVKFWPKKRQPFEKFSCLRGHTFFVSKAPTVDCRPVPEETFTRSHPSW